MGFYPLDITKYENGEFTVIGSGIACFTDENSPDTLTYEWEGEQVSEETFDSKVAEFYDLEQSRYPDNFKTYNEFVYQIKTGKWTSYDHRYEFIAADTTWDEAQEACKQKGGYLATIHNSSFVSRIKVIAHFVNHTRKYIPFSQCIAVMFPKDYLVPRIHKFDLFLYYTLPDHNPFHLVLVSIPVHYMHNLASDNPKNHTLTA